VADTKLVHLVEWLPVLGVNIKEVDFTISVCVLTTDQENFIGRNSQSTASPEWVLHPNSEYLPEILLDFVELNAVIDFLFSTSEEPTKGIDALVTNGAGAQVMSLVLHGSNLSPFVFPDVVLFDRA